MILNPATSNYDRNRSILALLLIVPGSSIGAISSTILFPGSIGQVIAICCGIWSKQLSLALSATFFTLHHIILLIAYCDDWRLVLVGSIAVFIAGLLWARCIRLYDSLLPSYLSHMAADLALQIVSWHILLG